MEHHTQANTGREKEGGGALHIVSILLESAIVSQRRHKRQVLISSAKTFRERTRKSVGKEEDILPPKRMAAHTSPMQDLNLFFIIFPFILCLYLGRNYIMTFIRSWPIFRSIQPLLMHRAFHGHMANKCLTLALIVTFGAGIFLELSYYSWCPISTSYHQTNLALAREIITTLNKINLAYWLDFATLLNVVRCGPHSPPPPSHPTKAVLYALFLPKRNEEVNPWEHDIDFSMLHPGMHHYWTIFKHLLSLSLSSLRLAVH